MSEFTRNEEGGYPGKRWVMIDGDERAIWDTNNLFSYIAAAIRKREREQSGEPAASLVDLTVEQEQFSRYLPHLYAIIDSDDERRQQVARQAANWNGYIKHMYEPGRTEEDEAKYKAWHQETLESPVFQALVSDVFEEMIPQLEADGIRPVELTV